MFGVSRLTRISLLVCLTPWVAFAQNNSFTTTIQNNAMMQSAFANQMINLGGKPTSGSGQFNPANCMPPADLQRGADGHVPPELQGDLGIRNTCAANRASPLPKVRPILQCNQVWLRLTFPSPPQILCQPDPVIRPSTRLSTAWTSLPNSASSCTPRPTRHSAASHRSSGATISPSPWPWHTHNR